MKTYGCILILCLFLADQAMAQSLTKQYDFTALPGQFSGTNCDGANPRDALVSSDDIFYGTAQYGGSAGNGTVFAILSDGTCFTNLHSFTATSGSFGTNCDGSNPWAGLVLSGNTLYGTTTYGGLSGWGTVFKINTDGTAFTNLHSFVYDSDGAVPFAGLILSGDTLYGAAAFGGNSGDGTVFKVNTNGTGFLNLHDFNYSSDGSGPEGGLMLSGNTLFGTTYLGGSLGKGTVFAVDTDGTDFTNLHNFAGYPAEGSLSVSRLVLSGNVLYGTTYLGGNSDLGTVFAISANGTGFTNLHSFSFASDGGGLNDGLVLSGGVLYGAANGGGSAGRGTIFALNTDGTGFTNLYIFTGSSDGAEPDGGLILSGNIFYGTTALGGCAGNGTVFSLSLSLPQLAIHLLGSNVILTWPTYAPGVTLLSATNLASSVWNAVAPEPVIANGQNTVTNPISGTQQFYRLSQ
jgi:uncharacterized repeat protein (TIGR03803 family)